MNGLRNGSTQENIIRHLANGCPGSRTSPKWERDESVVGKKMYSRARSDLSTQSTSCVVPRIIQPSESVFSCTMWDDATTAVGQGADL